MPAPEIILLLNGVTDVPLDDLGGVTPLQKSSHPNLDRLAAEGSALRIDPPSFGGHETSLLTLLGIHDGIESAACGPLIAAAQGIALGPNQRAYSVQLASAGGETIVDLSNRLVSNSEGRVLCHALTTTLSNEGCNFIHVDGPHAVMITDHPAFHCNPRVGLRPRIFGIFSPPAEPLLLARGSAATSIRRKSPALGEKSSQISEGAGPNVGWTTARHLGPADLVGRPWHKVLPKGVDKKPARRLLQRAHETLSHHEVNQMRSELEEAPVNALVLSEGGGRPQWHPLLYTDTMLHTFDHALIGVAKSCGIPLWRLPRPDAKFGLIQTILGGLDHAMSQCTRLFIDIPYLWDATVRGDLLEKVKTIEWLDRHLIAPLFDYCWARSIRLTVMPLRRTDIRRGAVTPGWVPCATYPATKLTHAHRFEEEAF